MSPQFISAVTAAALLSDGATVATDGFTMMGVAEEIYAAIETRFLESAHPRDLVLVHASGQSDQSLGLEHFAHDGLVSRVVGSHWGLMPRMSRFLRDEKAQAVCLPQGQLSTLYRSIAGGRPGNLSHVGLGTFVDPRQEGGKVNDRSREGAPDYVELMRVDGEEWLFYRSFPISVALIRATSVDEKGNCSNEEEAVHLDALALAQAARASGGMVIVQAKYLVANGGIPPKSVSVPGVLVDYVVVASDPEKSHRQTHSAVFDPAFVTAGATQPWEAKEVTARLQIGRRAARYLQAGDVVNVGTGIPGDVVGPALAESGRLADVTMTVESGVYGGLPAGGLDFGIARGPEAIITHSTQFDFYNGGGLDATFMGVGQVDEAGNVNVSRLGRRLIGCGGFIDIVQSTRRVFFCFTMGGLHEKFVPRVDHLTFSAEQALRRGQEVRYVTERAVFLLTPAGLLLVEIAHGLDVERDVLSQIPFRVGVAENLALLPDMSETLIPEGGMNR